MNEKEAIGILKVAHEVAFFGNPRHERPQEAIDNIDGILEVIEWLQKRADIKAVADNPPEKWSLKELPHIYELGKWMQKEAHMELDSFIVYGMNNCLKDAEHSAKLARRYLEDCQASKT